MLSQHMEHRREQHPIMLRARNTVGSWRGDTANCAYAHTNPQGRRNHMCAPASATRRAPTISGLTTSEGGLDNGGVLQQCVQTLPRRHNTGRWHATVTLQSVCDDLVNDVPANDAGHTPICIVHTSSTTRSVRVKRRVHVQQQQHGQRTSSATVSQTHINKDKTQ